MWSGIIFRFIAVSHHVELATAVDHEAVWSMHLCPWVFVSLSSDLSSLMLTMVYAPLIMAWSAVAYDLYAYGLIFLWPMVYASVA